MGNYFQRNFNDSKDHFNWWRRKPYITLKLEDHLQNQKTMRSVWTNNRSRRCRVRSSLQPISCTTIDKSTWLPSPRRRRYRPHCRHLCRRQRLQVHKRSSSPRYDRVRSRGPALAPITVRLRHRMAAPSSCWAAPIPIANRLITFRK